MDNNGNFGELENKRKITKGKCLIYAYACTLAKRAVFGYIGEGSSAQEIWEGLEIEKMGLVE